MHCCQQPKNFQKLDNTAGTPGNHRHQYETDVEFQSVSASFSKYLSVKKYIHYFVLFLKMYFKCAPSNTPMVLTSQI